MIKNWRPISLLSNLYKVLSRAIYNRLSTVMDRITSRAQKGFSSSRHLQEVLINVIEAVANCKHNNTQAVVVAVDQAKAFDTITNQFMSECYRFFGFGKQFINMMETVGHNRRACIITDSGEYTKFFSLETGRPQGEILSPPQYNIGQQICLFRIELDSRLASVFVNFLGPARPFAIPNNLLPANKIFSLESNNETNKSECFADDNSCLILRNKPT
jgi:hypothetical protein